jgi:excisionase family DNA binding protein
MPLDPLYPLPSDIPTLLEVGTVARQLKASPEFVRREIRKNQLPALQLGNRWRVDAVDLKAYIDQRRQANGYRGNGTGPSETGNGHVG